MTPGWWIIPGAILGAALWALMLSPLARVIDRDPGGLIGARAALIAAETAAGVTHEIRGTCASACTMHLANGCVLPGARLIFHGPQTGDPAAFDRWSQVMARHYPPAIRDWFMATGRYGQTTMSGATAIALGAREC